jgi:hypothetical protein
MKLYLYKDYSNVKYSFEEGIVIFKCEANNITEADALYKATTGADASKQKKVSVEVIPQ